MTIRKQYKVCPGCLNREMSVLLPAFSDFFLRLFDSFLPGFAILGIFFVNAFILGKLVGGYCLN